MGAAWRRWKNRGAVEVRHAERGEIVRELRDVVERELRCELDSVSRSGCHTSGSRAAAALLRLAILLSACFSALTDQFSSTFSRSRNRVPRFTDCRPCQRWTRIRPW